MIIYVDAKNANKLFKIIYTIKYLNKLRIEGDFPSLIKNINEKPKANIILYCETLETLFEIRNKIKMTTSSFYLTCY